MITLSRAFQHGFFVFFFWGPGGGACLRIKPVFACRRDMLWWHLSLRFERLQSGVRLMPDTLGLRSKSDRANRISSRCRMHATHAYPLPLYGLIRRQAPHPARTRSDEEKAVKRRFIWTEKWFCGILYLKFFITEKMVLYVEL